ncbi:MAG: DMT family transporter, partial [Chloroflexota bacterium]|nr:DMT family transporter [Chloroflexota bacterium]
MSRLRADLWLVLITVIWGSTFIIVKSSLDSVGPFVFVASRFWVAGALLFLLFLLHHGTFSWSLLRDGTITGLFLWGGFITQTIGLQTTEASKAAFITGLNVVLVPLFAALLLRKPPPVHAAGGVILATVGLTLMTLNPTESLTLATGDLWVLACAAAFAMHIIAIAHYSPRHNLLPFTLVQLLTVAILATIAAWFLERDALLPPATTLPAILYMGLISTAFVFGLQTWVQRYT